MKRSKILFSALCFTAIALPAAAQRGRDTFTNEGGCIGGSRCGGQSRQLRIPLDDRRIESIEFRAHDNIGDQSKGHLRVRIDDNVLQRDIDVPKNGERYDVDARGARGRFLVFEPIGGDEVVVEDIQVDYGNGNRGNQKGRPWDRRNDNRSNGGQWQPYSEAEGCIGGAKCGKHEEIRVRLDDRPIEAVRFRAHDNVGDVSRGHLRVRIDDRVLEDDLDVAKDGQDYDFDGRGARGRYLILESFAHDEVVVDDIEVLYRGGGRR